MQQLGYLALLLGGERPETALRLLGDCFEAAAWADEQAVAQRERILTQEWNASEGEWGNRFQETGPSIPWEALQTTEIRLHITGWFATSLWAGLARPSSVQEKTSGQYWQNLRHSPNLAEHGLGLGTAGLYTPEEMVKHGLATLEQFENLNAPLADPPDTLRRYVEARRQ